MSRRGPPAIPSHLPAWTHGLQLSLPVSVPLTHARTNRKRERSIPLIRCGRTFSKSLLHRLQAHGSPEFAQAEAPAAGGLLIPLVLTTYIFHKREEHEEPIERHLLQLSRRWRPKACRGGQRIRSQPASQAGGSFKSFV